MSNDGQRKRTTAASAFRKLCAACVSVCLITAVLWPSLPSGDAAGAAAPNDIASHWALPYIEWAIAEGLAQGYEDGSFRPQNHVTEAEFLAMLLRAYGVVSKDDEHGSSWSYAYYTYGMKLGWPLAFSNERGSFRRGQVAHLLAVSVNGRSFGETEAIQWLLDAGISQGRTSATVAGFVPAGSLTRAEALTFIYNVKEYTDSLSDKAVPGSDKSTVNGIAVGDRADKLAALLGQPARTAASEYDYTWHIYNGDYARFAMYGVQGGIVVAAFTNEPSAWHSADGVRLDAPLGQALSGAGLSAADGKQEETFFQYSRSGVRTTLFVDAHEGNRIIGALQQQADLTPKPAAKLGGAEQTAMELLLFDLVNAERARRGIGLLTWDKPAAAAAKGHSEDMKNRQYFSHTDPDGVTPFARMKAQGIRYALASENIAAGYTSSIFTHYVLLNSKSGHRDSILDGKLQRLGTGVAFGGEYKFYYTQNFYTPL